jgi:ribosomal protein S18 acetylase RimI-like enzyme
MNKASLSYRKATRNDMAYLLWLRKETMNEHLKNAGIEMNEEKHVERINYQFDESKIILLEGKNIGYLKTKEYKDKIEIIQIQIGLKYQNQGYGQNIINSIIQQARQNNSLVTLSVLKSNKAQVLYKRLGFTIVNEDNHSYIMELK